MTIDVQEATPGRDAHYDAIVDEMLRDAAVIANASPADRAELIALGFDFKNLEVTRVELARQRRRTAPLDPAILRAAAARAAGIRAPEVPPVPGLSPIVGAALTRCRNIILAELMAN
jgi:hypothetical protein